MSKARVFELSASKLQRMKDTNNSNCRVCDEPLKTGNIICSKSGNKMVSYRHEECARRVGLVD